MGWDFETVADAGDDISRQSKLLEERGKGLWRLA